MDNKVKLAIAALIFNFGLFTLATYVVAFHDWSLWTYLGFALFMVSTEKD